MIKANYSSNRPSFYILFLIGSFLILLVASGCVQTTANKDTDTQSTDVLSGNSLAVVESSRAQDANGIEVGFTEDGRPYRGDPNAPVVIEEFSDFQCPFCARFAAQTLPSLMEEEIANGEVVLVYYDFPLKSIHQQATAAANAARCAGEQGAVAYWAMHDRLFESPQEWGHSQADDVFTQYAAELALDTETFAECVREGRYVAEVNADFDYGRSRGVSSTPSFFINDHPLVGAQPRDVFTQVIAAAKSGELIAETADSADSPQANVAPTPATISPDNIAATLGNPDAPVTIVEFTDYQCPFCRRHAQQTMPQVIKELVQTGRIYYILKDFPLDNIHPEARIAATAAHCAGEQDMYWPMHDLLFSLQDNWAGQGPTVALATIQQIAADLGLDTEAFGTCLRDGRYDQTIQNALDEGIALGVRGTPAFFINGYPMSGAQPFDIFTFVVELAEQNQLADVYTGKIQPPRPTPQPVTVNTDEAYSIGDPNAPVTIIEFTDYQCPFCERHFRQTYPELKANYIDTGLVRYVFKDFPLMSIHPQALEAAQAARCAGEQEAYLGMHDMLFANQDEWNNRSNAVEIFTRYADELQLDVDLFVQCLSSGKYETAVLNDVEEGTQLGVRGTPAFFINGYLLSGAQPYNVFEQAINSFLESDQ